MTLAGVCFVMAAGTLLFGFPFVVPVIFIVLRFATLLSAIFQRLN